MVTVYPETSVFGSTFLIIWNLMAILFSQVFLVAELVGLWFTYKKMELPGWKGIIPFYNSYVLFEKLWEVKQFWRVIVYCGVFVGAYVFGLLLAIFGGVIAGSGSSAMIGIIMLILGIGMLIGSVVFIILALVVMFRLYQKLAAAFNLKSSWAWGLLFVPYIMMPIMGFHKRIQYYGPLNQV